MAQIEIKNLLNLKTVVSFLVLSLLVNGYFFSTRDSILEKNAFCAQYKEQAAKRISTYYTNGDVTNIYPSEIFYSNNKRSCVVIWADIEMTPARNGFATSRAIFDPITNNEYYSGTLVKFTNPKDNAEFAEWDQIEEERYSKLILDLKN